MVSPMPMTSRDRCDVFAGCVAHDLRTPLSALIGELQIALRRHRSGEEYRAVLRRLQQRAQELADFAADLAFLGDTPPAGALATRRTRVTHLLQRMADRFAAVGSTDLVVDTPAADVVACGDEARLMRAFMLLVDHAVRHRTTPTPVSLRLLDGHGTDGTVIVIDAAPPEFGPREWRHLETALLGENDHHAPGLIALHTAGRIVRCCGGDVSVRTAGGRAAVHVWLRTAATN